MFDHTDAINMVLSLAGSFLNGFVAYRLVSNAWRRSLVWEVAVGVTITALMYLITNPTPQAAGSLTVLAAGLALTAVGVLIGRRILPDGPRRSL